MAPTGDIALSNVAIAGRAVATGSTVVAARANPVASLQLAQPRSLPRALTLALALGFADPASQPEPDRLAQPHTVADLSCGGWRQPRVST